MKSTSQKDLMRQSIEPDSHPSRLASSPPRAYVRRQRLHANRYGFTALEVRLRVERWMTVDL